MAIAGLAAWVALIGAAPGGRRHRDTSTITHRLAIVEDPSSPNHTSGDYLTPPTSVRRQADAGAWATFSFLDLRDEDRQDRAPDVLRAVLLQDYRGWFVQAWPNERRLYLRLRGLHYIFDMAPGVPPPDTSHFDGLDLDQAWFELRQDSRLLWRIGRQYVRAGRGLALASDLDGVAAEYDDPRWSHRFFAGNTVPGQPSIDSSIVGFDKGTQRRRFFVGESSFFTPSGHGLYGYLVVERDHSRSLLASQAERRFRYNADFLGLGTEGRFTTPLHYFLEVIHQRGSALADIPPDPRVRIDAWGALAGLLYYPRGPRHPLLSLEYGFGSGDARRASVTNTFGGKIERSRDRNFLYFGDYEGGLALSPRLSNMRIVRLGYQGKLLPTERGNQPELLAGGKASFYFKDNPQGVTSDPAAVLASIDVGQGYDLFVGWKPFSDLSMFLHYGLFVPGRAYPRGLDDQSGRLQATTNLHF